jgi:hypothetical protein
MVRSAFGANKHTGGHDEWFTQHESSDILALAAPVNKSDFLANARRGARDDDRGARCVTRNEHRHTNGPEDEEVSRWTTDHSATNNLTYA